MLPPGLARLSRKENHGDLEALLLTWDATKCSAVGDIVERAAAQGLQAETYAAMRKFVSIPHGARARSLRKRVVGALTEFIAFCERHEVPKMPAQAYRPRRGGGYDKIGPPSPVLPRPSEHARVLLRLLTDSPFEGGDVYWHDPPTARKKTRGPRTKTWLDPYRLELRALLKADEIRELLRLVGLTG